MSEELKKLWEAFKAAHEDYAVSDYRANPADVPAIHAALDEAEAAFLAHVRAMEDDARRYRFLKERQISYVDEHGDRIEIVGLITDRVIDEELARVKEGEGEAPKA